MSLLAPANRWGSTPLNSRRELCATALKQGFHNAAGVFGSEGKNRGTKHRRAEFCAWFRRISFLSFLSPEELN